MPIFFDTKMVEAISIKIEYHVKLDDIQKLCNYLLQKEI